MGQGLRDASFVSVPDVRVVYYPFRSSQMVTRERVQSVLDRIRPLIQSDGGDIELVDVVDNKAKVRLTGNCVGCPSAQMTLYFGVEMTLKDEIPELEELVVV